MQAIGKLYDHDPYVVHHGQKHLANVFCLASFRRQQIQAADFGCALDELRHVGAKMVRDLAQRNFRIFDNVVKKSSAEGCYIQFHSRENVRYFDGMRQKRFAGQARLRFMLFGCKIVGAAQKFKIIPGTIAAQLVHQLDKPQIDCASGGLRNGGFACRFHIAVILALRSSRREFSIIAC